MIQLSPSACDNVRASVLMKIVRSGLTCHSEVLHKGYLRGTIGTFLPASMLLPHEPQDEGIEDFCE